MGLAQFQQVLAQLYTNSDLRERFFANPQKVAEELGLSVDEQQQISQLSAQQVNLFASSLKRKRWGEVRELIPLSTRVLGKNCSKLFWRYAETYLPQGIKKHWEDALAKLNEVIAFCTFLEVEGIQPTWVLDLIRYEKAWLQAAAPHNRFQVCWFRYAIKSLVRMAQGNETPVLVAQPTITFWFRLSPGGQLRHIVLPFSPAFGLFIPSPAKHP